MSPWLAGTGRAWGSGIPILLWETIQLESCVAWTKISQGEMSFLAEGVTQARQPLACPRAERFGHRL